MNFLNVIGSKINAGVAVGALTAVLSTSVVAEVVNITAKFAPDPAAPRVNEFKNTTPNSGYCAKVPALCETWIPKIFSIGTGIKFESSGPIRANASQRQGAMFSVPAEWKSVSVYNGSNKEFFVDVRITAIGGRYRLSQRAQELIGREVDDYSAHNALWLTGDWGIEPRPCKTSPGGSSNLNGREYDFFWMTPVTAACAVQALFDIPGFSYINIDFAYELKTPDPLKIAPGVYTGQTLYTVGPNQDFDMGDNMQPTDNIIQLDFTLTVDHVFSIELPPGGDKVVLQPQGGWQAWLNQGRRPTRLFRDQTFNVWTSTPFKMSMECEHYAANSTCALQDDKNNQVPVDVSVSLPSGLSDAERQSVSRRRLRVDGVGTERFEPTQYVDRKPGTLHFEVSKGAVEEILQRDSRSYSGDITVIWGSQV